MITPQQLYQSMEEQLLHPKFLSLTGLDKTFLTKQIKDPLFIKKFQYMASVNDFSCQATYDLCKSTLEELWKIEGPVDPLRYMYQYALSYSFPDSVEIELKEQWKVGALYFLHVLRVISHYEKFSSEEAMISSYPLNLLTEEECASFQVSREYVSFKNSFQEEYLYEMMKLNQDVMGHNTLDHICGVHHLAIFVARQLYQAGLPVDLGRVSGAAAGHDLGKFGCKSWEANRVAYLHYYYTDLWFKNHDIPYIGHIALNHSTWDLELENLSIESLILIYSDFRVKNVLTSENKLEMNFFPLKESFDVILSKLDNVDSKKKKRYERVYHKLKDFEDYIRHLGIEVSLDRLPVLTIDKKKKYYSLMRGNNITEHLKYLAIHHNLNLMHQLRDETSLNELLEVIRSENHPRNLREYLDVLQEYSTYLTQKQKIIVLRFLYEKLIHPEEDIRRQCAEIMGSLIALFDEDYRKEIPQGIALPLPEVSSFSLLEKYLALFIDPSHKIIPLHRQWIIYNTKKLITLIFTHCKAVQREEFKRIILKYYPPHHNYDPYTNICLLDIVGHIPLEQDEKSLFYVFDFVEDSYNAPTQAIRVAALKAFHYLFPLLEQHQELILKLNELIIKQQNQEIPVENYLKLKIMRNLKLDESHINTYYNLYQNDLNSISDIFLSNLKTATNWITKKIQVKMLLESFLEQNNSDGLYTAMHFCNLLKVSSVESVRNATGKALVTLVPHIPLEQRNDIAIELIRSLELESYQFTKYIPNYLGQVLLYLPPFELDEAIEDIEYKIKQSNNQIKSLLLRTIGVIITTYPMYKNLFPEEKEINKKREQKLLGILLNGLAHDDLQIRQISFSVLGKKIFGSKDLQLEDKYTIFQCIAKKILTLIADTEENQLLFLTNSSGLNHIYRFIADYSFQFGSIDVRVPSQLALFPGTFDPFTLGHKEVCRAIRDKGFEVYLAVDEFSWSKRTQPHLIRKNIITMSIAEEMDIYLYPEDFPINIANPKDLKQLNENFDDHEIFMVVGSDVVLNASAYSTPIDSYTIQQFPHVIFERRDSVTMEQETDLKKALENINNEVIRLNIPPQYEDISSTQIRNYIDDNMDISNLIDPLAEKYIYENSLYRREPQYKSVIQTISVNVDMITEPNEALLQNITQTFHEGNQKAYENIKRILLQPDGKLILISYINDSTQLIAYGALHWIPSDQIYQEFKDVQVTQAIRESYKGRIISLDGFFINYPEDLNRMSQIILTETLAHCLKNDYEYAIFHNIIDDSINADLMNIIKLQGFIDIPYRGQIPILQVDMTNPCALNLDLETIMKEPFKTNTAVKEVIRKTRTRLQRTVTELYPGNLVICFDMDMTHETLVKKICKENGVSPIPTKPRELGPLMCVPFGNILNRAIVPNTATKSLHVEKLFNPDMKGFSIGPYPYYLNLDNQIKMIGSFNKSVILVDDLLHKGYRIKGIDPILKKQGIDVRKTIVGILSGRGKELMDIQNREVDSAYFIPKLRLWFNENLLYPFIGGDTLWRGVDPEKNLLSSVNLVLPYTSPHFIKGVTNRSIYKFSEVSILNAMDILEVLEQEYQKINERKLTLSLLSDVFLFPRYPDAGENISYDLSINPSSYLKNDLGLLRKLEHSIITGDERRK